MCENNGPNYKHYYYGSTALCWAFAAFTVRSMLGESLVTTAWRVLWLRMEETPSSYGGQLRIY
jgi:hypothetical protein